MDDKGVSAVQLASISGVSRVTIGSWLSGASAPERPPKVRAVAKALGVPFEYLWGDPTALDPDQHARLAALERFAQRVATLVAEIVAAPPTIPRARPTRTYRPRRDKAAGDDRSGHEA